METLGILDAGIGGLGTYRAIKDRKNISILYFSDSGFSPYGMVPTPLLKKRLTRVFEFMRSQGADKIAVACNAASCALPTDKGVEGIIHHGVQAIIQSKFKNVGLIGGQRTIRSHIYSKQLRPYGIDLKQRIAQALSLHVESGNLDSDKLHADIAKIMHPLRHKEAVLLACTHYPAIQAQIKQHISPKTRLIDPAECLADWIIRNWTFKTTNPSDRWFTTGDKTKFAINGQRAFGVAIQQPMEVVI